MCQNLFQGLIVSSRKESLQHFKKPWAHEHEPIKDLLSAVKVWNELWTAFLYSYYVSVLVFHICIFSQAIKPTILIGSSGVGRTFTKEVIEAMASSNEVVSSASQSFWLTKKTVCFPTSLIWHCGHFDDIQKPLIMALSNPTSQSECTAEEAYNWTKVWSSSIFLLAIL